jgi:hypothetical protein
MKFAERIAEVRARLDAAHFKMVPPFPTLHEHIQIALDGKLLLTALELTTQALDLIAWIEHYEGEHTTTAKTLADNARETLERLEKLSNLESDTEFNK